MPLEPTGQPCHENMDGVGFAMKDGPNLVGVLVTHEVLQDIESPPPSEGEYVSRCEAYRSQFEATASNKYDAGQAENGGKRVRIITSDLSS